MKNYYLGPWVGYTDEEGSKWFGPPAGVVGVIDLAPVPVQGAFASFRPVGLFTTPGTVLASEYTLLASGDCREIKPDAKMLSAIEALTGVKASGDTLANVIYDLLTDGSDPDGLSGPKPLMPGVTGWCDIWLAGHSRVLSSRFEWGKPCSRGRNHWQKVKTLLRKEFEQLMADAKAGKLKDKDHHRRVLDFWCDKYGLKGADDWKELVPDKLQKDVPGRLKHQTTITDNFNRADASPISNSSEGWAWTNVFADDSSAADALKVSGNAATIQTSPPSLGTGGLKWNRAESDLSSSDNYGQVTVVSATASSRLGAAGCRFSSSASSLYGYSIGGTATFPTQLTKCVTGTKTSLATGSKSALGTIKCEANGSTITGYYGGSSDLSVTDTSLSSGLRTGAACNRDPGNVSIDDFQGADIGGGAGILYTQLERDVRGLERGTYTKWRF